MAKTSTDTSIPPPLRALGGWLDADWFCPSILSDDEVVGITLPKLPGSRKQNFNLVERSRPQSPPGNRQEKRSATAVKRPAAGIAQILDEIGVISAAAFRKPKFFFEGAAILYFAEIKAANLKIRAADHLRRELIRIAFRGCVVRHDGSRVTAMFWPSTEIDITAFVDAAAPRYALHADFERAEMMTKGRSGPDRRAGGDDPPERKAHELEAKAHRAEREKLLRELNSLRTKVAELQRSQSALGAMEALGLNDARLKSMLLLLHPDKHANSEAATEAAKWVNGLRDILKASRA